MESGQRRALGRFDWVVLAVLIALIAIGLLNLRNADIYQSKTLHQLQIKWYLLGTVMAVMVCFVDLHLFNRLSYVLYGTGLILLIVVLFLEATKSSHRWLSIPFIGNSFQPSEFMKIALVLALARLLHDQRAEQGQPERHTLKTLIRPFLVIFAPVILIFAEPDLGTAVVVTLIGLSMIFYDGVKWRSVLTAVGIIALVFPLAWKFAVHDYQKARVEAWLTHYEGDMGIPALDEKLAQLKKQVDVDPALRLKIKDTETELKKRQNIKAKVFQPKMAIRAIKAGSFWGKSSAPGETTHLQELPELHTDFVFAAWAWERGFIGATVLLVLFYVLIYWTIRVTKSARNRFETLVAIGIAATLFWEVFINIGMVTGLLPVVGVALPLLSYGGSSAVSTCIGIGLLFNISMNRSR